MNANITNKIYRSKVMERINVGGAVIEYLVQGNGEPVLLIPPSLTIDGLGVPLLGQPELASHYQLIHYHRRGCMGSTIGLKPLTFSLEASDAAALVGNRARFAASAPCLRLNHFFTRDVEMIVA